MNKAPQPQSIAQYLLGQNRKLMALVFLGSLLAVGLVGYLYTQSTLSSLCEVARLESEESAIPLARELLLGNEANAREIMEGLKHRLSQVAPRATVSLDISDVTKVGESARFECSTGTLSAQMRLPLSFAGESVGAVHGRLAPLHVFYAFLALTGALACALAMLLRLMRRLSREMNEKVVAPIQALAQGRELPPGSEPLWEVQGIQRDLSTLREKLSASERERFEVESARQLGEMASQVAHDIRSPLAALRMVAGSVDQLPEEERILIRAAVDRINDIANSLLSHKRPKGRVLEPSATSRDRRSVGEATTPPPGSCSPQSQRLPLHPSHPELSGGDESGVILIPSLLEAVVTEKRAQYKATPRIEIQGTHDLSDYGLFAVAQERELKRVLSNLIDNGVEALPDVNGGSRSGRVTVVARREGSAVCLRVEDSGRGIPSHILPRLGERGETHGKDQGLGLGLYHAKTQLQAWGGSLSIESELGKGTRVNLLLPSCQPPQWFVDQVRFVPGSQIVVLDDDISIHQVWEKRFAPFVQKGVCRLSHFSDAESFSQFVAHSVKTTTPILYLVDYELIGQATNGLKLIEELGIARQSTLVTSRWEESAVREGCTRLGLKLIPKAVAGFLAIEASTPSTPGLKTSGPTPELAVIEGRDA